MSYKHDKINPSVLQFIKDTLAPLLAKDVLGELRRKKKAEEVQWGER